MKYFMRLFAITLTLSLFSCTSGSQDDPWNQSADDDDDDMDLEDLDLEISWTIENNPTNRFGGIVEINTDKPYDAVAWIEYGEDYEFERSTPERSLSDTTELVLQVLGLKADREYNCRLVIRTQDGNYYDDDTKKIVTEPLPSYWPECMAISNEDLESFDDEEIFCSNAGDHAGEMSFEFCVDRAGEPVWMLQHTDHQNMNRFLPLSDGRFAAVHEWGEFVAVFDEFGQLVNEFDGSWFHHTGALRYFFNWINGHELIEIHEGPWKGAIAVLTLVEEGIDDPSTPEEEDFTHSAPGVIVFKPDTGDLLWDWTTHGESGDDLPIDPKLAYFRNGLLGEDGGDWMHANSLVHEVVEGKQYFWISARNQDWVFKVDVETDEVVWRFGYEGDFTLVDDLDSANPVELEQELWAFHQHAPEIIEHNGSRVRFSLFDNGNVRADENGNADYLSPYSRAVEFEIDESTMQAMIHFAYGEESPSLDHFYSHIYGNAFLLPSDDRVVYTNGNCTGGPHVNESGPYFAEVSYPQGEEQWRFTCPGRYFYRALYYKDIYQMTW